MVPSLSKTVTSENNMSSGTTTPERRIITPDRRTMTPDRRSRLPADDQDRNNRYLRLKETRFIRQCCECGDFKLYAPGSPSTTLKKQSRNESNPLDNSEPRGWDLCRHCGLTACNKILGLTRTHTDNVCGNQICAECGNRGCCQCDMIHDITEAHSPNLGRVIASVKNGISTPNHQRLLLKLKDRDFLATSSKVDSKSLSAVEFEIGPVLHRTQLGDIAQPKFLFYPYISSPTPQIHQGSTERYRTVAQAFAAAHCLRLVETHLLLQHLTAMKKPKKPPIKKDVMIGGFEEPDKTLQRELDKENAEFLSPVANLPQLLQRDSSETLGSPAVQEPRFDNESAEEEFLRIFRPFSSDNERVLHISREELLRPFVTISGDLNSSEPAQALDVGHSAQHLLSGNRMFPQNEIDRDAGKEVSKEPNNHGPQSFYLPLPDQPHQNGATKTAQQTTVGYKAEKEAESEARGGKRKHMANAEPLNCGNSDSLGAFESSNAFAQSHPSKKAKLSGTNSAVPAAEVEVGCFEGGLTEETNQSFDSYYQDFSFLSSPSHSLQEQSGGTAPVSGEAEIEMVPLNEVENTLAWFRDVGS
ncbi:hypothetical protein BDZ45DRAFT_721575 [Acephala macrosclerotiorum]|nr:hypothetical protein BDZ45DRAFT_721575 [Acephala macrosclerotiorum]